MPVLVGELGNRVAALDAGVVHEDVGGAEPRLDVVDAGLDRRRIGHVEGRDVRLAAGRRGDLARGALGLRAVAAVHDDGRAGLGEALRERAADALARAGDERCAPGEVEERGAARHQ
ncbi:hypothetical protein GCM10009640_24700 [Agrococcus citreus]|uniref:Uncharacterized protein n=1 Tax=Agrococcus citreus TaxID=84643 RepID=A0ABN1YYW6_9MICO